MLDRRTADTLVATARSLSDTILTGLAHTRALDHADGEPQRAAYRFNTDARKALVDMVDAIEAHVSRPVGVALESWHRARVTHARHDALGLSVRGERRVIAELALRIEVALDETYPNA